MSILVTGATSGLGRNAIEYLHHQGISCMATGRNPKVAQELMDKGVDFFAADLADVDDKILVRMVQDKSAIWHVAALSSAWGAYDDFYKANVIATQKLAMVAAKVGVPRFIHISTPSVYFDFSHRYDVCEHELPKQFVNHYATTKYLAERALCDIAKVYLDTQFVILRPRAIFGAYDRVLLPKILQLLHQRKGKLPLPNHGNVLMDVSYANNVVHAMRLATDCDFSQIHQPSHLAVPTYNITNGTPIRLKELLSKLFCKLNQEFVIKTVPYPILATLARTLEIWGNLSHQEPKLTAYSAGVLYYDMTLSIKKAQQELGYQPPISLDDAIARTAVYLQNA